MSPCSRIVRSELAAPGSSQRRTDTGRPIAAGGWRRAVVGLVVGAVVGAAALVARRHGTT